MSQLSEDLLWAKWKNLEIGPLPPPTEETKPEQVKPKPTIDWDLVLGM